MFNLERLSDLTADLSQNLVKSIVLPGEWLQRLGRSMDRSRQAESRPGDAITPGTSGRGLMVLTAACPIPDEAVVAIIRHCGGRNVRVRVIPAGVVENSDILAQAVRGFQRYGMTDVEVCPVHDRPAADDPQVAAQVAAADVVFLCGEDGQNAREVLAESELHWALRRVLEAGKVVAGAGAGAAVLAERMVVPAGDGAAVAEGLGLLAGVAVPCGFDYERGHNHLLHAVGCQLGTQHLGVSLAPRSALVIQGSEARVLGDGPVTFVDGREAVPVVAEAPEPAVGTAPTGQPPVCGLKVHVLVPGYGLNLKNRRPVPPRATFAAAGG